MRDSNGRVVKYGGSVLTEYSKRTATIDTEQRLCYPEYNCKKESRTYYNAPKKIKIVVKQGFIVTEQPKKTYCKRFVEVRRELLQSVYHDNKPSEMADIICKVEERIRALTNQYKMAESSLLFAQINLIVDEMFVALSDTIKKHVRDTYEKAYARSVTALGKNLGNSQSAPIIQPFKPEVFESICPWLEVWLEKEKGRLLDEIADDIYRQIHPENTEKEIISFLVVSGMILLIGVTLTGCADKLKKADGDAVHRATIEALKDSFLASGAEQYKIVANEDGTTCERCADMSGKVFEILEFQPGDTAPPFHPNCRCLIESHVPEDVAENPSEDDPARHIKHVFALAGRDKDRLSHGQQTVNAEYIYHTFTRQGWTVEAICGLLGNVQRESHFNPGVWQDFHNLSLGYGLVQWDDASKFLDWAGLDAQTADNLATENPGELMDLQLDFLIWSCQSTTPAEKREWFATSSYDSPYKMTYAEYISSTHNAGELALVFHASYERSNDTASIRRERIINAENWHTYFTTGLIPSDLFER